jgi:hypothetical protein
MRVIGVIAAQQRVNMVECIIAHEWALTRGCSATGISVDLAVHDNLVPI